MSKKGAGSAEMPRIAAALVTTAEIKNELLAMVIVVFGAGSAGGAWGAAQ